MNERVIRAMSVSLQEQINVNTPTARAVASKMLEALARGGYRIIPSPPPKSEASSWVNR